MKGASVSAATLEQMAAWYTRPSIPPAFRALPEPVVEFVQNACAGDWRRCVVEDGAVTVYNHPLWEPR